ncbi:hypothetical protein [Stenotrophomonas phage BUCTxx100]|nr:hypothetical protein [Stenotrophomonas phage BUCTxx100]
MTTPTQNDIPSSTATDVRFNAEKFDEIINSDESTYVDRFGNERFTAKGLAVITQAFFDSLSKTDGYKLIGSADSFATLRSTPVTTDGQRILLDGWNSDSSLGGGEFVGRLGSATDDGGVIAAGDGFYWERIRKSVLTVLDFGAIPNYYNGVVSYYNSTASFKAAAKYSATNRVSVHIPASEKAGQGYYVDDEIGLNSLPSSYASPGNPGLVASLRGDGKNKTLLFWNNKADKVLFSCYTTSGYPTALEISGFSLLPIDQTGVGTAIRLSGTNQARIFDIFMGLGLDIGIDQVNGVHNTWTELSHFTDIWIRYPKTAGLYYRLLTVGPNGEKDTASTSDSSFSGDTLDNVNIEINSTNGAGIKIGIGVHLYNSFWRAIINAASGSYFIYNEGSRNRSTDFIQMEGEAGVFTSGWYNVTGGWTLQSQSGVLKDSSTEVFVIGNDYMTPKKLTSTSISDNALPTLSVDRIKVPSNVTPARTMIGISGSNIESIGTISYSGGNNKLNGFGIFSSAYQGKLEEARLHYMLSLGGIYSTMSAMVFDHFSPTNSDGNQLSITKNGLHRGKMGLMYSLSVNASASAQTITQVLSPLSYDSTFDIVITMKGSGVDYTQNWVACWGRNGNNSNGTKIADPLKVGPSSGWVPPQSLTVSDAGVLSFTLTTPVNLTIRIQMIGKGAY